MSQLLIVILDDLKALPKLLTAWRQAGVPGATIVPSAGAYRTTTWLSKVGLGALDRLFEADEVRRRTVLAVIVLGVLPQGEALAGVDWNVIFLLAGMMIIANILRDTGIFQWGAIQAVKLGRGEPMVILLLLVLITAVSSALLDNVAVVVLIAPVTLFVATSLGVSPLPFLIAEVMASNIGGVATLIGDPPNVLIASAADLDFITFSANLTPVTLVILAAFCGLAYVLFRPDLQSYDRSLLDVNALDARALITDPVLLRKSLLVLAAVILGFLLQGSLHLEPAAIAMTGATLLMLWARSGHPISFRQWLRYGIPVTLVSLLLANIYLALRYW